MVRRRHRSLREQWKILARRLKLETLSLSCAIRDPRTPWYARALAALVVAYALSPVDLIPDFVPVLGYLDDLVVVPLGVALAIRLIPKDVYAECRELASRRIEEAKPVNWIMGSLIIATWAVVAAILGCLAVRAIRAGLRPH